MIPSPGKAIIEVIAFDADDTLWHNQPVYTNTKRKFEQLLSRYHASELDIVKLDETEIRNIRNFGYGIKGFTLSMIEAAVQLTDGHITSDGIIEIINLGKAMTKWPVELLKGVQHTVAELAQSFKLLLVTKGDLFDQESKIARSGLAEYFTGIEIVSEKTSRTYELIMAKHNVSPDRFMMVGNSVRSDMLPVVASGGRAVYVPYPGTWFHENSVSCDPEHGGFLELEHIGLLPALIAEITSAQCAMGRPEIVGSEKRHDYSSNY
jgi:putative hydrolase of the HAD superfamily